MMVFDLNSERCALVWCLNMSVTQGKALVRMRKWVCSFGTQSVSGDRQ